MNKIKQLEQIAEIVRRDVLEMAFRAKSAHTGGSLSTVEILTTLYFDIMHLDPKNPWMDNRDRLIFSKAHDCKVLYAALAERGYFSKLKLRTYEQDNGLPGHSTRHCAPGIEVSAGSLGHGLSLATGFAYAGKLNKKQHRIFAILSDGECDEGSTWEAILFAGHHKLDNLVAIVDYNKFQAFGATKDVLNLEPFSEKWKAFGWEVKEVDGHNIEALHSILKKLSLSKNKPTAIIAHTIKGYKGVKKHVGKLSSHYKPPQEEELKEIDITFEKL